MKYSRNNIIRKDKRRKIKKQMVEFVSFLKSQDWLKVLPGRTWPPPSTGTTIVERLFSEQICTFSCNGNFIHQQSTFQFTVGNDDNNNNNNNTKNNTIDRHSTRDRLIDASLSSTSEESSVSRRVRHNIERGGRMESHVTNEIICSFAIVKNNNNQNSTIISNNNNNNNNNNTSNGNNNKTLSDTFKENVDGNNRLSQQSIGLYAYFQGTVCLIDHTQIIQLGYKENNILCFDLKHYVHFEIAFSKSQSNNKCYSIYRILLESLSPEPFVPIAGWYESSIPSSISSSSSSSQASPINAPQHTLNNNIVNNTITSPPPSINNNNNNNTSSSIITSMLDNNNNTTTTIANTNDETKHITNQLVMKSSNGNDTSLQVEEDGNNTNDKKMKYDDRHYDEFLQILNDINNVPCPYNINWNECKNRNTVSMRDDTQLIDLYEKQMSKLIIKAGNSFCQYKSDLKKNLKE